MDKVAQGAAVVGDIFNKLSGVVVSIINGLGLLGKAVGKVLKGEFREAADLAKESFDGVKEAVVGNNESFGDFIKNARESAKETVRFAKELVNLQKEVKLAEAQQRQLQLTYQRDAELQRQLRDDISLTFEERIAANEELGKILDAQFAEEQALAQKKVALAELELSRNKDNVDLQVAVINAKTELADLDERITGQRSEQLTNLKALEKEQADAIQDTIDAENKKLLEQEKAAAQSVKIAKEEAEKKAATERALQEQKEQILRGALGKIAGLVSKDSKKGKKVAKALAIIDTFAAANKALAQGGIMGIAAAAGIVATGIANVKAITAQKLPDGDDGGGGGDEPSVPSSSGLMGNLIPNVEAIDQTTLGEPAPVQAYVVENDISNAQALQEELEIQSTL